MAMTTCPSCQSEISDQASACPICGQPLRKVTRTQFGQFVKWGFVAFNVVMMLSLFGFWGHAGNVANQAGDDAERAGVAIGGMLGTGFVMFVWFIGFVIGAFLVLMTRPAGGTSAGTIPVSNPNSGDGLKQSITSTASSLQSSIVASAKAAGQITARQAEKVKLNASLPKLYWKLGKHGLSSDVFRAEFQERYQEIDKLQTELARTAIHQQAKDTTIMEKAKATAGNALQTAQASKLSVTQATLISRLGRAIYERHRDNSGPEELVTPIREAVLRLETLDKDIGVLSQVGSGSWITPKRMMIAGAFLFLLVIGSLGKQKATTESNVQTESVATFNSSQESEASTISSASKEERSTSLRETPSNTTTNSASSPNSPISWEELDAIYNLKHDRTDLQKEEAWKKFKGKQVLWTGEVTSVSTTFGTVQLQVRMNTDTLFYDLLIDLKPSEKSKAAGLSKGDSVTFKAILERFGGAIMAMKLRNGEVIVGK